MKTKDNWLEEIHNENLARVEQLQSDLEDIKDENLRLLESNVELRGKLIKIMEVIGETNKSGDDNYFI
jgi:hypothetical protein